MNGDVGSMLILISGPYMTGTDGDEARIRANLERMEQMALPLYERYIAVDGACAWPRRLKPRCPAARVKSSSWIRPCRQSWSRSCSAP